MKNVKIKKSLRNNWQNRFKNIWEQSGYGEKIRALKNKTGEIRSGLDELETMQMEKKEEPEKIRSELISPNEKKRMVRL